MKNLIIILTFLFISISTIAQSPEKLSYQAVIRDESNLLVCNQTIGIAISILQGSSSGAVIYEETHTVNTNTNGLMTLEIGTGISSDDFSSIEWENGPYFIKTESDLTGGEVYTITSISELISVPYALYAKTAENLVCNSNDFYLGQDTLGGIVYYLRKDSLGIQHGLIVSKIESVEIWQNSIALVDATRSEDGSYNTGLMFDSPAKNWVVSLGPNWYLPSIDELNLLWQSRYIVNTTSREIGTTLLSNTEIYWSSTERNTARAYAFSFDNGTASDYGDKTQSKYVRAIKSF